MKRGSKWVILLAAAAAALICGCGRMKALGDGGKKEEIPTITICTVNSTSEQANERISKVVSRITREKLGCNVEIIGWSMDKYEQQLSYLYLSRQMPDIFAAFELTNFERWIDKGAVLPMEELILPYKEGLDEYVLEKEWLITTLNGHLYGIPSSITENKCMGFVFRRDICEELGIDWRAVKSMDDLHEMLLEVKKAYPDMDMIVPHSGKIIPNVGQDRLNNNLGVLLERGQKELKTENLYASDYFECLCKRMKQWNEEGLFMNRAYAGTENRQNYIATGQGFGSFLNLSEVSLYNIGRYVNYDIAAVQLAPRVMDSDSCNMVWCIGRDSKEPELAMEVLNLMFMDYEISKILTYGEEGVDYSQVNSRFVTACSQKSEEGAELWRTTEWAWPVSVPIERWMVNGEDLVQYIEFWDEPVIESSAMGFLFDASKVRTEVDACQAVINKYENPLLCGELDPETAIPMFLEELDRAGIQQVIQEKQRQLDLFKEKQRNN